MYLIPLLNKLYNNYRFVKYKGAIMQGSHDIGELKDLYLSKYNVKQIAKWSIDRFIDRFYKYCFWAIYRRSKGSIKYIGIDGLYNVNQI